MRQFVVLSLIALVGIAAAGRVRRSAMDEFVAKATPDDFRIHHLPGLAGGLPTEYKMFSGLIPVVPDASRQLFFWFVEKEHGHESDTPLTVWFNGGPGCSSLAGMLTENGPFRPVVPPTTDNMVERNGWSWNRVTSMLFIESPAGVGFSILQPPIETSDNLTATWNHQFLQNFLQIFPEYKSPKLWITGESYAGVYIPMLVERILADENSDLAQMMHGFMLGNPVIDCPHQGIIMPNNLSLLMAGYFWHALAPYHTFAEFVDAGCMQPVPPDMGRCEALFNSVQVGAINGDDLWENYCVGNGTLDLTAQSPSCITPDDVVSTFLNRADVQEAIHAQPTQWTECNENINYTTHNPDMLLALTRIYTLRPDISILFYSGDSDIATVPFQFTQLCLNDLNPVVVNPWRPYSIPEAPKQVAGYVEEFDKFTYMTIRGAGHEAPAYQPATAFYMFSTFMASH